MAKITLSARLYEVDEKIYLISDLARGKCCYHYIEDGRLERGVCHEGDEFKNIKPLFTPAE